MDQDLCQHAGNYLKSILEIIERIQATQMTSIKQAAEICAECISHDALVHMFATGHSRVAVEEMFPRFGSFVGFNPLVELSLTYHTEVIGPNGHAQAMFLENVPGLGRVIAESIPVRATDVMLIFSNSGAHTVAVELALAVQQQQLPVIVVTSVEQCNAVQASHPTGLKLIDVANVTIDTCNPLGDALVSIPGIDDRVGPGSTIATVAVANTLKCQVATELIRIGAKPTVLVHPQFGATRSQESAIRCYDEHRRRIGYLYSSSKKL